jgi:2-oxo-4-hydroxy-4-carboxy-5-ureidoimidazoline decarboxylase
MSPTEPATEDAMLTLDDLNARDEDGFVAAVGSVFENSPWIARDAWGSRPFASVDELHAAMMAVITGATSEQVLTFLNAHPELAGREAQHNELTRNSAAEQANAGLGSLTRDELDELTALNRRYRTTHGFPFILAVAGHDVSSVLGAMRDRQARDTGDEIAAALDQIGLITRRRLDVVIAQR